MIPENENIFIIRLLGMPNYFHDHRLQKRVNEGNMFDQKILKRNSEPVDDNNDNNIKRNQQKRRLFLPKQYWNPKIKSFEILPSNYLPTIT